MASPWTPPPPIPAQPQASGRDLVASAIREAKSRGEKLPRKPRRPLRPHHPFALEAEYFAVLRTAVKELYAEIHHQVQVGYEQMTTEVQRRAGKHDALESDLGRLRRILRWSWVRKLAHLERRAAHVAKRVATSNLKTHQAQLKHVLGVNVIAAEPWLADEEAIWTHENAALIKDLGEQAINRVARLVSDAVRSGTGTKALRQQIQGELGIAERRAALIAVDQVGKYNGRLTQRRQQAIGVEEYLWRGVLDQRERPAHVSREGQKFRWDNPPPDGNPGIPIRCRCTAEPLLDIYADLLASEPETDRSIRPSAEYPPDAPDWASPRQTPEQHAAAAAQL